MALTAGGALADVARSLREASYMFWDTLWALVLGFGVSGAVQAFVSRDSMQRRLGSHRPAAVARSCLYGMASSSCSYAASAMARSLFAGGADYLAAMVFMLASTNLVIELGLVLLVLIGWQFVAAEFLGGVVMIVLLVLGGSLWLRGRALAEARARTEDRAMAEPRVRPDPRAVADDPAAAGARAVADDPAATDARVPAEAGGSHPCGAADRASKRDSPHRRIRTVGGWSDAAGYTMSDLKMLRKEMLVGFVAAGLLTVLVPAHVWADLFIRGHGFWTGLENVAVAPFVAMISFVCSVGNVPLAAALWNGGISFGGVVAFMFADLITLPLLFVYRKQYGGRMALRMLGLFWLVMSAAGLATDYIFRAVGWIPTARRGIVVGDTLRWDWTTYLDIAALVVFAGLYWLYRNRERLGGAAGYAKDPVCGMQVDVAHAPASVLHDGESVYFCSEKCRDRFLDVAARTRLAGGPSVPCAEGEADADVPLAGHS